MHSDPPITELDLHAWLDAQLDPARSAHVSRYLDAHPDAARRVAVWRTQKEAIRAQVASVAAEALPDRLIAAARGQMSPAAPSGHDLHPHPKPAQTPLRARPPWRGRQLAAGCALTLAGVVAGWAAGWTAGWTLRGSPMSNPLIGTPPVLADAATDAPSAVGFAQRAAVAHAVYTPEERRPVEIDATHEALLIAWLSRRMGSPMRPPDLQSLGYTLEGGRLLPGRLEPVAQFMYRDAQGQRVTLYVSNKMSAELASAATNQSHAPNTTQPNMAFHFLEYADLSVFYWIDGNFGYALSAATDRAHLAQLAVHVYQQFTQN